MERMRKGSSILIEKTKVERIFRIKIIGKKLLEKINFKSRIPINTITRPQESCSKLASWGANIWVKNSYLEINLKISLPYETFFHTLSTKVPKQETREKRITEPNEQSNSPSDPSRLAVRRRGPDLMPFTKPRQIYPSFRIDRS